MNNWNKSVVTKQQIEPLCNKYGIDQILASILVRRNITEGNQILYYLEDDLRFQHDPFNFSSMEDAVERITAAEEEHEKILIFGDKDVDGVTSTTILYEYLKGRGLDVQCRLPLDSDSYGLSIKAIDDFAAENGTLIITVDCGISNVEEIEHANTLGIDVIVTDHHNAPDVLPPAVIIIDPKLPDSGYPFVDISGAAVAYKLVSALRYSHSEFYNAEICLMNIIQNEDNTFNIDCVKIRNNIKIKELHEKIIPGRTTIYDLKLPYFLQGQIIYVWNVYETKSILKDIFGSGIEFNLYDLQEQIVSVIPSLKGKTSEQLLKSSKIAKYNENQTTILDCLFNLYITYCQKIINQKHPDLYKYERQDLQLVALAAIGDIMPLVNENRIFVKNGINSMKNDKLRPGLAELFATLKINPESVNATDLSWTITPSLNAAGRLGQADVTLNLLISEDPKQRDIFANKICELNEERKSLVNKAAFSVHDQALQSIQQNDGKLCVIVDESIHPGITGNFAGKLMQEHNVPVIVVTASEDIYKGSMRSCRGLITTDFLSKFGDFFINYGGHNAAAGFSFKKELLPVFYEKIHNILPTINLEEENLAINIDAEIPPQFLTVEFFDLLDILEPFGAENSELSIVTKNIKICDAIVQGKKEPLSLKLIFDCGKLKFQGIFFGQAKRLNQDIFVGQNYDILYTPVKNFFNGTVTPQIRIKEIQKS